MTQEFSQDLAFNHYFEAIVFGRNTENIFAAQGTVGAPTAARSGNTTFLISDARSAPVTLGPKYTDARQFVYTATAAF